MIEWMYEPKYKKGIKEANNNQMIPNTINFIAGNLYLLWHGGVFDQLARYTMAYQESDLHLGLLSSLTSANNLNPTLVTLFYFLLFCTY